MPSAVDPSDGLWDGARSGRPTVYPFPTHPLLITPGYAGLQDRVAEIEKVPELETSQAQVGLNLLIVSRDDSLHRLELQKALSLHDYVRTAPFIESYLLVANRHGNLKLIEFIEDGNLAMYDLKVDPGETHNLAATNPERARQLLKELKAWRQSVGAQMMASNPDYDPKRAKVKQGRQKETR